MRFEYVLNLPLSHATLATRHPVGGTLRNPRPEETEALAELLLDAYRGTIDDEGEGTDEALEEVNRYLLGRPLLDCSWVYASGDIGLSASLVGIHNDAPWLHFIVTRPTWKHRGLGAFVLRQSLLSLQDCGYSQVHAMVTEGNVPSEHLMARFGFVAQPNAAG